MRVSEFIEKMNALSSVEAVYDLFRSEIAHYGYSRLAFLDLTPSSRRAIFFDYPPDYAKHYEGSGYVDVDPILINTPGRSVPFLWSDVFRRSELTPRQKQVFREAEEAGLRRGAAIPVHGPRGQSFGIYLADDSREPESREGLARLQVLGFQIYATYNRLTETGVSAQVMEVISDRERECLLWTARGKSAWEISMILGLSEHTITFYLKNAMKKLQTSNRVLAVVKAIQSGLIQP